MIRFIWQFKFLPIAFLMEMPRFCVQYLKSRSVERLQRGLPALALTATMAVIMLQADSEESRSALKDRYSRLSRAAVQGNNPTAAETYFARVLTLSTDPVADSFRFANQLFEASGGPANTSFLLSPAVESSGSMQSDQLLRRSLMLMQSLAPRRAKSNGYPPAHDFMATFWQSRLPQTDLTTTLAMQHKAAAAPTNPEPALRLAKFISERGYHQQALDVLKPLQEGNAEVQMLSAAEYGRLRRPEEAIKCLSSAESILTVQLAQAPNDVGVRLSLSRVQAAQGRLLESMLLLAEGCQHETTATLVDSLISRYVTWLAAMKPEKVEQQLTGITLALEYSRTWDATYSDPRSMPLHTSSGRTVSVPGPIVAFHTALLNGDGAWLVPLLLGTDAAARADYGTALKLLREGYAIAPGHPVIANNLAWTLTQKYSEDIKATAPEATAPEAPASVADLRRDSKVTSSPTEGLSDPQDQSQRAYVSEMAIQEAWQLANETVKRCPDVISFRETRGTIAAITGRWPVAASDLQMCVTAGKTSVLIRQLLKQAQEQSGRDSDR